MYMIFDLTQFNTLATELDLRISAANELDDAVITVLN